jgi:hypothetical protein
MAILLEETLTLYQRTTKERVLKINIGSKVNTNAITEANFKLQKDLMAWVLQKNQFQIIPLHNSTIAHSNERVHSCRFLLWNI